MAKLYVTEYHDLPQAYSSASPQLVREPPLVDQTPVVIGASALQSAPLPARATQRPAALHIATAGSGSAGFAGLAQAQSSVAAGFMSAA